MLPLLPEATIGSKDRIPDRNVFRVEPGFYFQGRCGIRREDTLLLKNKPIALTRTSKDLLII